MSSSIDDRRSNTESFLFADTSTIVGALNEFENLLDGSPVLRSPDFLGESLELNRSSCRRRVDAFRIREDAGGSFTEDKRPVGTAALDTTSPVGCLIASVARAVLRAHLVLHVKLLIDIEGDGVISASIVGIVSTVESSAVAAVDFRISLGEGLDALFLKSLGASSREADSDGSNDENNEPGGEEDAAIADGIAAVLDLAGEAAHAGSNDSDDREDQEGPEENGTDVCEVDFIFHVVELINDIHEIRVGQLEGEVHDQAASNEREEGKDEDDARRRLPT